MKHPQSVQASNTIVFHRREEDVTFDVEWAAFSALQNEEDDIDLLFYVRAQRKGVPNITNAEVSIFVQTFVLDELVGKRFEVPQSWDAQRDDHVSCIYCYEHKDFDQIVVEIVSRDGDRLHVHWTGQWAT